MAAIVQMSKEREKKQRQVGKKMFGLLFANCRSMFHKLVSKFGHSTTYYLLIFRLVAGRGWYYIRTVQ